MQEGRQERSEEEWRMGVRGQGEGGEGGSKGWVGEGANIWSEEAMT